MPRPCCCRRVAGSPRCSLFKPAGIPASSLEEVVLQVDELEAIRLTDLEGMYQEDAAAKMGVSRQTIGRIVESARKKVADALTNGKSLRMEGGVVEMAETRGFRCRDCNHGWEAPFGSGRPSNCPKCNGANFCRQDRPGGGGRGHCHRGGRG